MEEICKICHEKVENDKHFYRKHGVSMADYYVKYLARRDIHTGERIPFKNKNQYLESSFVDKNNLKKFIKDGDKDKVLSFCIDYLKNRKEKKQLIYSPTQSELKSLIAPTIITYNRLFPQGYYALCQELGFKNKHNPFNSPVENFEIPERSCIYTDTREQNILKCGARMVVKKLEFGDYYVNNPYNIYIERKSLNDFIGTLGKGLERFNKEIERAEKNEAHLIIMTEEKISNALSFNHLPWMKHTKATPDYIFKNMRDICQAHSNCQFLFVDGRRTASTMLEKIFFSDLDFSKIDCQLAYERNLL